jgi:uncharacterized membrane protein YqjE
MRELKEERSIGELLGQLSQDMALLVRQEMELAKTEINEKLTRAVREVTSLVAGGLVAYLGMLTLVATLILVLHEGAGLAAWVAGLIVTAILAIAGFILLRGALRGLKRIDPTPRRTVETIKDDIQWAKEQP